MVVVVSFWSIHFWWYEYMLHLLESMKSSFVIQATSAEYSVTRPSACKNVFIRSVIRHSHSLQTWDPVFEIVVIEKNIWLYWFLTTYSKPNQVTHWLLTNTYEYSFEKLLLVVLLIKYNVLFWMNRGLAAGEYVRWEKKSFVSFLRYKWLSESTNCTLQSWRKLLNQERAHNKEFAEQTNAVVNTQVYPLHLWCLYCGVIWMYLRTPVKLSTRSTH